MFKCLEKVRRIKKVIPLRRKVTDSVLILFAGLALGVLSKLLDIYTNNWGNVFSQMSIWILIGTIIAIYSSTPKRASINVFLFCIGMLVTYYITAHFANSIYSWAFIYGWSAFALFSPVFAYLTWFTKGRGWFAKVLSCGIILFIMLSAILLFHRIRFSDMVIIIITCCVLFIKERPAI